MSLRIAVMGFRHGHINAVWKAAGESPGLERVACCEEHEPTRRQLAGGDVAISHDDYGRMLDEVPCDVVAVGDYYGRRGEIIIEALRRGKHVISDKPICTSLAELDEIERLAGGGGLVVGCMLDLRDSGVFLRLREIIRSGRIGEVLAISFNGQHPLMYGERASWYFEEGKHGGTINDIAIHLIDGIPWLTGLQFKTINAARSWNAKIREVPHFMDGGQMMMTMANGAGVLGDVSYFTPDSFGYSLPQYWRVTVWGSGGMVECSQGSDGLALYENGRKEAQDLSPAAPEVNGYLDALAAEIGGQTEGLHISSAEVLASSRLALRVQEAADQGLTNVEV
jgi:predicted dehydrogenase